MEPRAHHVLIGSLTILAVAVALLFAFWLGKGPSAAQQRYYTVIFNETVRGLSVGSGVQYNGIKVGEVTALELDPRDPRKVLARVRVDGNVPIKQDIEARLTLTGITGTSVIEFSAGSPESPDLVAKDDGDPVIVASQSPITKLLEDAESTFSDLREIILHVKQVLSPDTVQNLRQTVAHLEKASGAIASQDDNIKVLGRELVAASRQANAVLQQASGVMDDAQELINNEGKNALRSADRAMASLEKSADAIDQILVENRTALAGGIRGLNELGPTLQELRDTLVSIRRLTLRLEDDPAEYLTGRQKIEEIEP
ncbi:phospholipid/cholesterol/gamma-HCH transport system substrate-binding protein [Nitrosospira sp. Nsp14]|uniref:MlaD family protein n=1 Tax=Nitrosospira sp. Nsp14 TaxID=1855333 RepID=UPI0008DED10B|nr:MlaD family protein [Nitrosospira sp. Nsp14]SFH44067.1 phospholipid/cholesterol/gamma-HCH transport system substrate-binding protein [Nitrosospira sp. Nsp14]